MIKLKLVKLITEDKRRKQHAKRMAIFSLAFMCLFIVIIILGLALAEGRTCLDR
jgi:hypothetical protein